MAKNKTVFVCSGCGYESPKWMGQCPGCKEWNTFVEEIILPKSLKRLGGDCFYYCTNLKKVNIPSVAKFWDFTVATLANIK